MQSPRGSDVACQVQNFHLQEEECIVETRGRIHSKVRARRDHFVVLDLAAFAQDRCLETIRYTAISFG